MRPARRPQLPYGPKIFLFSLLYRISYIKKQIGPYGSWGRLAGCKGLLQSVGTFCPLREAILRKSKNRPNVEMLVGYTDRPTDRPVQMSNPGDVLSPARSAREPTRQTSRKLPLRAPASRPWPGKPLKTVSRRPLRHGHGPVSLGKLSLRGSCVTAMTQ